MPHRRQRLHGKANMPAYSLDLHHRAYPELAAALRSSIEPILLEWRVLSLQEMPHLDHYTLEQFQDDLRIILESVAVALESADPELIRSLIESAPRHGFHRFLLEGELLDLFTEERILRGVMIVALEHTLSRKIETDEAASLHAIIDIMIQQGVLAMVQQQKDKLREAADAELKFLSFFSHDLGNNLLVINSSLQGLSRELQSEERYRAARELLDMALRSIKHTTDGMRRLLQHAKLRGGGGDQKPALTQVNLHTKFQKVAAFFSDDATAKGMRIAVDVAPDATIETDPDLLFIILQNIVGNAVKHCQCAEVRVTARFERTNDQEQWRISIADDGQGIQPDQLDHIFHAVKHGHLTPRKQNDESGGTGLGLTIAAQAAKLLEAKIDLQSQPGKGTTFHVLLPRGGACR